LFTSIKITDGNGLCSCCLGKEINISGSKYVTQKNDNYMYMKFMSLLMQLVTDIN